MRKYLKTVIIVAVITGAAVWGFQRLRFFEKLPVVFNQPVFAETIARGEGMGRGQGGFRGGRGREILDTDHSESQSFPERGRGGSDQGNGMGRGRGGHGYTVSPAGWVNVGAYLSVFAFFVMLTYYGERGVRTLTKRQGC